MKLNSFNGGLLTRVDASLIGPTQSTECVNVNLASGPLTPVLLPTTVANVVAKQYAKWYDAKDEWVFSATEKDFVEYQGKLYWTQVGFAEQYDGATTTRLGILEPTTAPSVTAGGVGGQEGTYQYAYSYYNDNTGVESTISELSREVELTNGAATIGYTASTDSQVTHIRIYRIGGTWTDFLLLETVTNVTGTFFDDIADEDLKGRLMGSVNNSAPYENLRYLTERFGTFYGVLGTKLYYTKGDGYAQYWPRTNYFELFEPITSIASIAGGLLIFTKTSTSLLVGSDAATFALLVLDKTIGCISHACTVSTGSTVLFLSSHGLCAATTSGVDHITLPILGSQQLASVCAVYVNKCYYLQLTSGQLLCLDFRYGTTIYYLDFASTYITTDNEALFLVSGGVFKQAFTGAPASYSYATGLLTEGEYTNLKSYNKFYLRSTGDVTVSIQIDGDVVLTKALSGDTTHEITPPQQHRRGYGLKLAFSGTGTVFEVVTLPTARET